MSSAASALDKPRFAGCSSGTDGNFEFVAVDFLRGADYFAGDRAQLGFREVLLAADRRESEERKWRTPRKYAPRRANSNLGGQLLPAVRQLGGFLLHRRAALQ